MQNHLAELVKRHHALDRQIETEALHPTLNDLQLRELKRKKLALRDEIERIKSQAGAKAPTLH